MQFAAHASVQGGVDNLVLLHAGYAAKRLADHGGGVVVAVARQILDRHPRVRAEPP